MVVFSDSMLLRGADTVAIVPPPELGDITEGFSIKLWVGTGVSKTIINNIDLSGIGGMVWFRVRNTASYGFIFDTLRGPNNAFYVYFSHGNYPVADSLTSFNSDGFSVGSENDVNYLGKNIVSWTFRRAAKFFDMVQYTGNGVSGRSVSHSLDSEPGLIIVMKITTGGQGSRVYHKSLSNTAAMTLNGTSAPETGAQFWNNTDPSSSDFTLGNDASVNANGSEYIAYLFAYEPTGNIQTGSYTGNGSTSGPVINLGWEPQYLLIRKSGVGDWILVDAARGIGAGVDPIIKLNVINGETLADFVDKSSTGFQIKSTDSNVNSAGEQYIYMAVRAPS